MLMSALQNARFGAAIVLATIFCSIALSTRGVVAQRIVMPADVLVEVETVNQLLQSMVEANFSELPERIGIEIESRRPRHVFQKAREAYSQLQILRRFHGLERHAVVPIPGREVMPADVKQVVLALKSDIMELTEVYGILIPKDTPALPPNTTATDVYRALSRTIALIHALDIPAIAPNDAYQVAETIIQVIEEIRAVRRITRPPRETSETGKIPREVYAKGRELILSLRQLTHENPDYALPGGVIPPPIPGGSVTPHNILDLFGVVLAELAAIKVRVGAKTPTSLAPIQSGHAPADVFSRITHAAALVETLK